MRQAECIKLRSDAYNRIRDLEDGDLKTAYQSFADDLTGYIANYDRLLANSKEIPEDRKGFYHISKYL